MIKKGIILAGGKGSRMSPLTKAVNKQLLPIYDKPLIYYPLSVLMLAGIREILIIVNKGQLGQFKKIKLSSGCKILLHPVKRPEVYGVAKIDKRNKIISLIEKPKNPKSNLAVTGLYFFDNKVVSYSKSLKPSKRKEIEIIDLLNKYKKKNKIKLEYLGRGGAWLDAGSVEDFYNTSAFVSAIENRQGLKIACLEEIAFNYSWINKDDIKQAIKFYGKCTYSNYLKRLIK